jgi:hypothetical protein
MSDINQDLLKFFMESYQPGIIGLVGTNDTIGVAIREAQRWITPDGAPSLWSHCFIFGEIRFDRRGPGRSRSQSPYIFESDLKVDLFKSQIRNGAQENWVGKWCAQKVETAAVIDFSLSGDQQQGILATALQLVDEQVRYPIYELLGTWWAIITRKQWKENPVDDPHAMYCSAFVRHCYKEAGKDFMGPDVSVSNTTPEHIALAGKKAGALKAYAP